MLSSLFLSHYYCDILHKSMFRHTRVWWIGWKAYLSETGFEVWSAQHVRGWTKRRDASVQIYSMFGLFHSVALRGNNYSQLQEIKTNCSWWRGSFREISDSKAHIVSDQEKICRYFRPFFEIRKPWLKSSSYWDHRPQFDKKHITLLYEMLSNRDPVSWWVI